MILEDLDSLGLPEKAAGGVDRTPKGGVEPWRKTLLELGNRIRQPELRDQLVAINRGLRFIGAPERLAALERLVETLERLTTEYEHALGELEIVRHKLDRARREAEAKVARALSAVDRLVHKLEADAPARDSRSDIEEALRADAGPGLSRLFELVKQIAQLMSDRGRIEAEIADCLREIAAEGHPGPQPRTI